MLDQLGALLLGLDSSGDGHHFRRRGRRLWGTRGVGEHVMWKGGSCVLCCEIGKDTAEREQSKMMGIHAVAFESLHVCDAASLTRVIDGMYPFFFLRTWYQGSPHDNLDGWKYICPKSRFCAVNKSGSRMWLLQHSLFNKSIDRGIIHYPPTSSCRVLHREGVTLSPMVGWLP
jgi:hypothetical protein